jgi:hypothetical protein
MALCDRASIPLANAMADHAGAMSSNPNILAVSSHRRQSCMEHGVVAVASAVMVEAEAEVSDAGSEVASEPVFRMRNISAATLKSAPVIL